MRHLSWRLKKHVWSKKILVKKIFLRGGGGGGSLTWILVFRLSLKPS